MNAQGFGVGPGHARMLGILAIACALATVFLLVGEVVVTPAARVIGITAITASCGATLAAAALLLRRGSWRYGLNIAGLVLMLLGIAAGAVMPDGLDAAAILPLAGAVLTLPEQRGRPLAGMFILAFLAAIAGESTTYLYG